MRSLTISALALLFTCVSFCQADTFVIRKVGYGYVGNYGANNVSVIDTSSNTVVATIPVGANPFGVAVDQAGRFVYVANSGSNNVSVISTDTNTVVATIPVGPSPLGLVVTPNGKDVYVANSASASVSVIDTATRKVIKTISVQSTPEGIGVPPVGNFVYVANSGANTVSVLSTLTNAVVATVNVGATPTSVAPSPDSFTVYVTNSLSNSVSVIRTADNSVINTFPISVAGPNSGAVSPDGHYLYVASPGAVSVVSVLLPGRRTPPTIITGPGRLPFLSFTHDSAFAYVTEPGANAVGVINTATQSIVATIPVGAAPAGIAVMGTMQVSTFAGGFVGDHGQATQAGVSLPYFDLLDTAGNLYFSEALVNRVRKVDLSGVITTFVGNGICAYNGDNIPASQATVCFAEGLTLDPGGNIIFADGVNARIRKIDHSTGVITTIAGTGAHGYSGDGGSALKAQLGQPDSPAYDSSGNLYFSDIADCVVRKVDTSGIITTVAGTGTCGYNGDGIPATTAQLNEPVGIALDSSGNLYISDDLNARVRKVDGSGTITTFAGTGDFGCTGDGGPATMAAINAPGGLTISNGVLYITRSCARVRSVDLNTDIINTYAGSTSGYDGDGNPLLASRFAGPHMTVFDNGGNPIIADAGNGRIRKATSGVVHTIAGGFLGDGLKATSGTFMQPAAMALDRSGNMYIADAGGNRVRKISGGIISTLAGTSVNGYTGDGGPATSATLNAPQGVTADSAGNTFIADTRNRVIRKVNSAGIITTFANNSGFGNLLQMASDPANNIYVADGFACVIWKITPTGIVSVVAGVLNTCGFNGDGIPAVTAQLSFPQSVAFDSNGNMLIADDGNARIREVNTSGIINTIAGNGVCGYTGDGGQATAAEVCPTSVAVDKTGTIYEVDGSNIRKIQAGIITTFAGNGFLYNGDGLWPLYTGFSFPIAVSVDANGTVYELDFLDCRVRQIK